MFGVQSQIFKLKLQIQFLYQLPFKKGSEFKDIKPFGASNSVNELNVVTPNKYLKTTEWWM